MKATELIAELQEMVYEYGDIDVCTEEKTGDWATIVGTKVYACPSGPVLLIETIL